MLTTVIKSGDKKTGAIPVTYRSGSTMFGTCPNSCALKPTHEKGAEKIDLKYFKAVAESAPRGGIAWTYIHFDWRDWKPLLQKLGKKARTIFNFSADTIDQALESIAQGIATTLPVPESWHAEKKSFKIKGVKFVQCPATARDGVTCSGSGGTKGCGGSVPLCARERDYVITFPAHGAGKKRVMQSEGGGCYAAGGPVRITWNRTAKKTASDDAATLKKFVAGLPGGSMLRHHVAGDCGKPI